MNVTIIGTGYVGLVSGACLADAGNAIFCVIATYFIAPMKQAE